ncbi:MAG: T9SS type A sorting domain-containing protein [Saprospirales bacterium]|nr:T9SS type A sorting domain-containing protein [Saprospirales bacterium]
MRLSLLFVFILTALGLQAQLVWTDPPFPRQNEPVTIYFDASQGNAGLDGCNCSVYIHTGVFLEGKNGWQNVPTVWGQENPDWKMTSLPGQPGKYYYEIQPTINDYYNVAPADVVTQLAFVFRNATGSLEGKTIGGQDIFYPVYPADLDLTARFVNPSGTSGIYQVGDVLNIWGVASESSDLFLYEDGNLLAQVPDVSITYSLEITTPGNHDITLLANNGLETSETAFSYVVPSPPVIAALPAGADLGINLLGDTSMILALYAPWKESVYVIGSFTDWTPDANYQMNLTPDSTTWWIQVNGLESGATYTFQYLVDGGIRIGDPYSTLVLDPDDDPFIPAVTYPNLPPYPQGKTTGYVSMVQPGAPAYEWAIEDFDQPDPARLTVYELLIRDFIARHDYTTLIDTLDYLQHLGINAIELMPINEFEGNLSWGYNPSYHMALDKYYGTINECKRFIDSCHARGIAVILDVVYNHAFGESPLAQLYLTGGKPSPESPWLNPEATHPFSVGYDFNHESPQTRYFVKKVMTYWLNEFKVDGFRFDLSKGFTQVNNPDNIGAWGAYDASRIAILKDYADAVWAANPDAYVILEHFADLGEEKVLAAYGMMLWANVHGAYTQTGRGLPGSLNDISYKYRNYSTPSLVHYMESHDEERIVYSAIDAGNSDNKDHNVKNLEVALRRIELNSAFFYTVPGPVLLWQFGELGYDYRIDYNGRTGNKPIKWDYFSEPNRRRLYDVVSALTYLRNNYEVFHTTNFALKESGNGKRIELESPDMNVTVLGNFGVFDFSIIPFFPHTGLWFEYFSGDTLLVEDVQNTLLLTPSEYRLYSDVKLPAPPAGYIDTKWGKPFTPPVSFSFRVGPNPSDGMLEAYLSLPEAMEVKLELFDMAGKRLQPLFEGTLEAGEQRISKQLEVPAGVYLLLLTAGEESQLEKLIVH